MRKITEATRILILNEQQRRKREHHTRVGELLIQNKFIDAATRDQILLLQRSLGAASNVKENTSKPKSTVGRQALITFLSIFGVAIATLKYSVSLELAIVVAGFAGGVLETIFQYKSGRSLPLSIQRAVFPVIAFVVLALVVFAVFSIMTIKHDPAHLVGGEHTAEEARIKTIALAFTAMGLAVGMLLFYALWKFHALRFAESRLGATKDILIRVEAILSDNNKPLETRRAEAIQTVLKGLRNAIRLSLADRILRVVSIFRQSFNQARVLYFVHDAPTECFRLVDASYPEKVSEEVLEGFKWIEENHRPCLLNQTEFERLKEVAKLANPEDWKRAYLRMPERHHYISVCGWIHDKEEVLVSENASQCLALDNSFLRRMEDDGFGSNILQWLEIGSFVGCRIAGKDQKPGGVLLVIKNIRKGFPPEDLEVVIIASQILGRILQAA